MRYSKEYDDWATRAERNPLPSDRERAALTAAKIRDNHSGSSQDSGQLSRMEKLAGYSSRDYDDWPTTAKKQPPKRQEPEVIPGQVEIAFTSDEFTYTDTFFSRGLSVEYIEGTISSYLASRNDLDYTIHGFEDGGRLTKNTFRTKVMVSDYDTEKEEDYNDRSILIEGRLSPAIRRQVYRG
jgi:hypothetical protein